MKKLLTILVLFSLIGFKATTVSADDKAIMNKLNSIQYELYSIESDVRKLESTISEINKDIDALKAAINGSGYGSGYGYYDGLKKIVEKLKTDVEYLQRRR